jgi:hypothetical protein
MKTRSSRSDTFAPKVLDVNRKFFRSRFDKSRDIIASTSGGRNSRSESCKGFEIEAIEDIEDLLQRGSLVKCKLMILDVLRADSEVQMLE